MSSRSERSEKVRTENFYTTAKMVPRVLGPPQWKHVRLVDFQSCQQAGTELPLRLVNFTRKEILRPEIFLGPNSSKKVRVGCFLTAARMVPRYILGPPCFGEICGNLTSSNSLFRFGSLRTFAKPVTISNGVILQLLIVQKKTSWKAGFLVTFLCWKEMQTCVRIVQTGSL